MDLDTSAHDSERLSINDQLRQTIRDLRKEKGWSQDNVADKLEMSRSNYTKIEIGVVKEIKSKHLARLCDLYGVNFETLRYGAQQQSGPSASNPETQVYITKLVDILSSRDRESIEAIKSNLDAFHSAMTAKARVDELQAVVTEQNERLTTLEQLIRHDGTKGEPKPPKVRGSSVS
jgi:transcriptional regulator with XRE-family HTH domain